jgi:lanthionine-containing peptide SapB
MALLDLQAMEAPIEAPGNGSSNSGASCGSDLSVALCGGGHGSELSVSLCGGH